MKRMENKDFVKLKSCAGTIPKLDEELEKKIAKLRNPTLDKVASVIREYQEEKTKMTRITLKEEEIYRFTI
jgi:hypothetical protein